jgi:hypothetical protein
MRIVQAAEAESNAASAALIRSDNQRKLVFLIVADRRALAVLSAACRLTDLIQEGAFVVESLESEREPLPRMSAVYFVAPEPTALLPTFRIRKPQHIHQTGPVSASLTLVQGRASPARRQGALGPAPRAALRGVWRRVPRTRVHHGLAGVRALHPGHPALPRQLRGHAIERHMCSPRLACQMRCWTFCGSRRVWYSGS